MTKYKTAAEISEKVLAAVKDLCIAGEKIVDICEKGDVLLAEEISKVWRGKKVVKGTVPAPKTPKLSLTPPPCSPLIYACRQVSPILPPSLPALTSLPTPHSGPTRRMLP